MKNKIHKLVFYSDKIFMKTKEIKDGESYYFFIFKRIASLVLSWSLIFFVPSILWNLSDLESFSLSKVLLAFKEAISLFFYLDTEYFYVSLPYFLETLVFAILATFFGFYLGIPLAILQSKHLAPSIFFRKVLRPFFAGLRAIPSLIWAAILVQLFSLGNMSGVLALTIITTLMSSYLFRESLDDLPLNFIYLSKASGQGSFRSFFCFILPYLVQNQTFLKLNLFETALRGSSILGLVGAGGIGLLIRKNISFLRYDRVATLVLLLFVFISIIELIIHFLKKRQLLKVYSLRYSNFKHFLIFISLLAGIFIYFYRTDFSFLDVLPRLISIIKGLFFLDIHYLFAIFPLWVQTLALAVLATFFASFLCFLLFPLFSVFFFSFKKKTEGEISKIKRRCFFYLKIFICKLVPNFFRTFPPLVLAILFLKQLGPGPLAGLLAMIIYTLGVFLKWFVEWLESLEKNLFLYYTQKMRGTYDFLIFYKFLWAENKASFFTFSLYRLEGNIRNSSILGMVGAGGIGFLLSNHITWHHWDKVGSILVLIIVANIFFDFISFLYRRWVYAKN